MLVLLRQPLDVWIAAYISMITLVWCCARRTAVFLTDNRANQSIVGGIKKGTSISCARAGKMPTSMDEIDAAAQAVLSKIKEIESLRTTNAS